MNNIDNLQIFIVIMYVVCLELHAYVTFIFVTYMISVEVIQIRVNTISGVNIGSV